MLWGISQKCNGYNEHPEWEQQFVDHTVLSRVGFEPEHSAVETIYAEMLVYEFTLLWNYLKIIYLCIE